MNEITDLENHLRSWAPRRPSPKLEKRLFRQPRPEPKTETPSHTGFRWLVPATAALLFCCLIFNRNTPGYGGSPGGAQMVALIVSNQSAAAYLPGSFQRDQNILSGESFEWTNGAGSTSSIRSLSAPKGNH